MSGVLLDHSSVISVEPTAEPVTLDEAKSHLRVTADDDDAYIRALIKAARKMVESDTKRALVTQTWIMYRDSFPVGDAFKLELPPIASITSISYLDVDGNSQTLATSVYDLDATQWPGHVRLKYNQTWPGTYSIHKAVTVTYVTGVAVASVSETAKAAMKLKLSGLYEGCSEPGADMAYESLLGTLRWGHYG